MKQMEKFLEAVIGFALAVVILCAVALYCKLDWKLPSFQIQSWPAWTTYVDIAAG
jgi:hypothetical protein